MTPPFLFLLAAAGIFRWLSSDANKAFNARLERLLPRKVMDHHLRVLLANYPDLWAEFRRRVLPYSGLNVAFNVTACGCFVAAVWYFPPSMMEHWDLIFVRYVSLLVVPVALLVDGVAFTRTLLATFARRDAEADEAV